MSRAGALAPAAVPSARRGRALEHVVEPGRAQEGLSDLFGQVLPLGESLGVSMAFLALSFWIFANREYVMEQ